MDLANALTTEIKYLRKYNENLQQDVKHLQSHTDRLQRKNEELLQENERLTEKLINQSQQIKEISNFSNGVKQTYFYTSGLPEYIGIRVIVDTIQSLLKDNKGVNQ